MSWLRFLNRLNGVRTTTSNQLNEMSVNSVSLWTEANAECPLLAKARCSGTA